MDVGITAPPEPGKYILEIDLVKENEFWFSERNSQPYSVLVKIKKKLLPPIKFPIVSVIVITYNREKSIKKV